MKTARVKWPKVKDIPKWTAIYIEYYDTVDHSSETPWELIEGAEQSDDDMYIYQVGLLYKITTRSLTLVFATDKQNQMSKRMQIPRGAIKKLKIIDI